MAGKPRYSDDYRASAVLMVEADGDPTKNVHVKRLDLRRAITDELRGIFEELGNARGDASYRDLATAAGIFFDKLQLLNGDSTANTNQRILVEYYDDTHSTAAPVALAGAGDSGSAEI